MVSTLKTERTERQLGTPWRTALWECCFTGWRKTKERKYSEMWFEGLSLIREHRGKWRCGRRSLFSEKLSRDGLIHRELVAVPCLSEGPISISFCLLFPYWINLVLLSNIIFSRFIFTIVSFCLIIWSTVSKVVFSLIHWKLLAYKLDFSL